MHIGKQVLNKSMLVIFHPHLCHSRWTASQAPHSHIHTNAKASNTPIPTSYLSHVLSHHIHRQAPWCMKVYLLGFCTICFYQPITSNESQIYAFYFRIFFKRVCVCVRNLETLQKQLKAEWLKCPRLQLFHSSASLKNYLDALSCLIALPWSLLTDHGTIWKLMRYKYYGSKLSDTGITVTDGMAR